MSHELGQEIPLTPAQINLFVTHSEIGSPTSRHFEERLNAWSGALLDALSEARGGNLWSEPAARNDLGDSETAIHFIPIPAKEHVPFNQAFFYFIDNVGLPCGYIQIVNTVKGNGPHMVETTNIGYFNTDSPAAKVIAKATAGVFRANVPLEVEEEKTA